MNWNRIGVLPSMLTVKFVVYTSVVYSVIPDPIFYVNSRDGHTDRWANR
jgi:hypothetical protein